MSETNSADSVLMKLVKFAFLAITLVALANSSHLLANVQNHDGSGQNTTFAMEPASFLLVGLGMLGGGAVRRKRFRGLYLVSSAKFGASDGKPSKRPGCQTPSPDFVHCKQPVACATQPRPQSLLPRAVRASHGIPFGTVVRTTIAVLLLLLCSRSHAWADPISFSTSAVSSTMLAPSNDSFSLNASTGSVDSDNGVFTFQTGDFVLGNSPIPDQVIPFSFLDSITLNGIQQTLTFSGQDSVTDTADVLTIAGGSPVAFGDEMFTLQTFTATGFNVGDDLPITLQASVTPTPEPGSLLLLGTGTLAGALVYSRKASSRDAER